MPQHQFMPAMLDKIGGIAAAGAANHRLLLLPPGTLKLLSGDLSKKRRVVPIAGVTGLLSLIG
jgi:hypothetical protein